MKVSFGTTKYCSYFTRSTDCPNIRECLYLHQWHKDNEVTIPEENSRKVFREQKKTAEKVVLANFEAILRRKSPE